MIYSKESYHYLLSILFNIFMTHAMTKILNVDILPLTQQNLLNKLKKGVLITPNVDHLVKLQKDKEFYKVYQQAEWIICDSKILYSLIPQHN